LREFRTRGLTHRFGRSEAIDRLIEHGLVGARIDEPR
jgi:hypothetical protein